MNKLSSNRARRVLSYCLLAVLTVFASGCEHSAGTPSAAAPPSSAAESAVFISVISDMDSNPQAVDMALKLAGFSLDEKRSVFLFFNVKGVRVPVQSLDDEAKFGENESIKTQLAGLIDRGATVHVCPICMQALSVEAGDLIEGASVTTKASLFEHIQSDTTVFTY